MKRVDDKERTRRLDEDFIASLDMVSEGAPDYAGIEDSEEDQKATDGK